MDELIYDIFDKYTDSYSKPVKKEICDLMKDGIKRFSEASELPKEVVEIIG